PRTLTQKPARYRVGLQLQTETRPARQALIVESLDIERRGWQQHDQIEPTRDFAHPREDRPSLCVGRQTGEELEPGVEQICLPTIGHEALALRIDAFAPLQPVK